jgi:hypothetical protein
VTPSQIKAFLQLGSSEHDVLLSDLAERAAAVAESYCDRTFAVGTYTPATTPDDALLDGKGLPFVYTPQWPIVSVTSLKQVLDGNAGDVQTYASGSYAVNKRDGKITLVRSAATGKLTADSDPPTFPEGTQNIAISYVAGYATLPADLVEAVILIAAHMFGLSDQRRLMAQSISVAGGGAGGTTSFAIADMPVEARARLDRYRAVIPR